MKTITRYLTYFLLVVLLGGVSCTDNGSDEPDMPPGGEQPAPGGPAPGGGVADDGELPGFDYEITAWNGETASDAALDAAGTDADMYHEANSFSNVVTVTYNGASATVESSNNAITSNIAGAYVAIDMLTNSVAGTEIVVKGKSEDGGLKIYGNKKFKLTLQGVELASQKGPAINNQCKKGMFVHLADGTTNSLADAESYSDDTYYNNPAVIEDRKGCFFSEGNMLFSGSGVLSVAGKNNHAVVTDGLMMIRPGVTLVVTEAANNAIHVKGDLNDNVGLKMNGGLVYANVASVAGKAVKCDLNVEVAGGTMLLNVSGDATYDTTDKDTSSATCIKAGKNIIFTGGKHVLKSTGSGGKGLNADGEITVAGGEVTITTTGGEYVYSDAITSSPKAVKADGNVTISGGVLNIAATGKSDGTEGLDSGASLSISGGETFVYAYDDAVNITSSMLVSGGKLYAYSSNNDGIDANSTLTVSGGVVIGVGTGEPESGIDVDKSDNFVVKGGVVIALGGALQSSPSSSSTQCSVVCKGLEVSKNSIISVLDSSGKPVIAFESPRSYNRGTLMLSSSDITTGKSYTVSMGGSISGYASAWNGWFAGGSWSGGTEQGTISVNGLVTTLGN